MKGHRTEEQAGLRKLAINGEPPKDQQQQWETAITPRPEGAGEEDSATKT